MPPAGTSSAANCSKLQYACLCHRGPWRVTWVTADLGRLSRIVQAAAGASLRKQQQAGYPDQQNRKERECRLAKAKRQGI